MKKITDSMRLDWIFKNWYGSRTSGEPWHLEIKIYGGKKWTGINKGQYYRESIDAAIRGRKVKK